MKKEKLIFLIFSFIIGITIALQLKSIDDLTGGIASSQKSRQLQSELKSLRDKKLGLEQELQALELKAKELKDSELQEDYMEQELRKEIDKFELMLGQKEAIGPGIVIKFQSSDQESQQTALRTYNYELLLSVINKLNASGAEGIAINEERYVNTTFFQLVGDKLYVNGNPIFEPYEIRAVGNPDTMESALNLRYGVLWEIRKHYNINASIEKKPELKLPRFTKNVEFKYSMPVEN